jgi:hypothetical protein
VFFFAAKMAMVQLKPLLEVSECSSLVGTTWLSLPAGFSSLGD